MKTALDKVIAGVITIAIPAVGYISFGPVPALLFLIGYLGGLILWLSVKATTSFSRIKWIYWFCFMLFLVHRVEEKVSGFFDVLAEMTGVSKPEVVSLPIILLLILSVGAWLFGPFLASRENQTGKYLVWTFFASMGITELAHFIFPLFRDVPYGYFPGMISVIFLAPVAWYGIYKYSRPVSL
jgi:hypothetical protein